MRSASLSSLLIALTLLVMCAQAVGGATSVDYVLLVDNTGTMRYGSRDAMTLEALRSFIDQTRVGDRVSVYSYGETSRSELSEWPVAIRDQAAKDALKRHLSFSFDADRTDITSGMELVWSERDRVFPDRSKARPGGSVLIVMTDGKLIPNYDDYSQYDDVYRKSRARLMELAGLFGGEGITVHSIVVGRADKVDGDLMRGLASKAGGSCFCAETADGVPAAYNSVVAIRPADSYRGTGGSSDNIAEEEAEESSPTCGWSIQDNAWAENAASKEQQKRNDPAIHANGWLEGFPVETCHTITGALAILVGVVAVGAEKRRKWAAHFTADLFGTGKPRVRGFLKPVDRPGTATARPCIGLENPGLESVRLGVDTSAPAHAETAEVMFVGSKDGSPPTIVVQKGNVTVNGELTCKAKLADGDLIEIEGLQYQYLRGNRR